MLSSFDLDLNISGGIWFTCCPQKSPSVGYLVSHRKSRSDASSVLPLSGSPPSPSRWLAGVEATLPFSPQRGRHMNPRVLGRDGAARGLLSPLAADAAMSAAHSATTSPSVCRVGPVALHETINASRTMSPQHLTLNPKPRALNPKP